MPRDARLELAHAYGAPAPRSRVVVGAIWSESTLFARIAQLDSDIHSLDQAVDADIAKMKAKIAGGGTTDDADKRRLAWMTDWQAFKLDWSAFKAKGVWGTDEEQLSLFEQRYRQLHEAYVVLPGAIMPPSPPSPLPTPPNEKAASAIPWNGLVWIGGGLVAAWILSSAVKAAQ
jgi:hypothetical protein